MQIDMHFYGTYAVARIAGFSPELARIVATATQFVDEAVAAEPIEVGEQRYMLPIVSAHEMLDIGSNFDKMDQWKVWVPFHFLPGGEGSSVDQRLVCLLGEPGNVAVEDIIQMALEAGASNKPYALHLLGIVSHVIQDTYAHYGFSGMGLEMNKVEQDTLRPFNVDRLGSYISRKLDTFKERVAASFAEASMLGHAGAATFPDRPYLKWGFEYSNPDLPDVEYLNQPHDNPVTFYQACTRLHAIYKAFLEGKTELEQPHLDFDEPVERNITQILAVEGKKDERCGHWVNAISARNLFDDVTNEDQELDYSSLGWGVGAMKENPFASTTNAFQYHRAAHKYLEKVHDDILPKLKILVD